MALALFKELTDSPLFIDVVLRTGRKSKENYTVHVGLAGAGVKQMAALAEIVTQHGRVGTTKMDDQGVVEVT